MNNVRTPLRRAAFTSRRLRSAMRGIIETSLPSFAEDALGIVEVILDVAQHQGGPGGIQLNIVAQPRSLGSDGGRNQPVTSLFQ